MLSVLCICSVFYVVHSLICSVVCVVHSLIFIIVLADSGLVVYDHQVVHRLMEIEVSGELPVMDVVDCGCCIS